MQCVSKGNNEVNMSCWLAWFAPHEDYIKLNTDGSFRPYYGLAGAGRVLLYDKGGWLPRFVVNLAKST